MPPEDLPTFTPSMGREGIEISGTMVIAPGEHGLPVRVLLLEEELAIVSADGQRETWSRDSVSADPYDTSTMQLGLGTTTPFFEADEPLEFAQHLADYIAEPRKQRKRSSKRSARRDRNETASTRADAVSLAAAPSNDAPSPQTRRFRRRQHQHTWTSTSKSVGGGIAPSRCVSCGQISIDLTSDHELTADPSPLRSLRR